MLSINGLRRIWSSVSVSRYYPLTLTTFWVEHHLWELNPLPYHAVNVALHAANAVLLWMLLRRLKVSGAWLAAAIWTIHPVCVESVAWATELKNVQSGFFFFLAVLCFLRSGSDNSRRDYALALAFGAAAMLSKPSTVVLPIILLLCVGWQNGRCRFADLLRAAPFFGLALAMSVLTVIEQRRQIGAAHTDGWQLSAAERLVIAGKAVWFYAAHVLWPANLTFIYPHWKVSATSSADWLPLAGAVAVGALLWACRRQPWARAALFGTGFFLATLLPVMGFFNIYYFCYSFVADHFQYLACIGLISLTTSTAVAVAGQSGPPGHIRAACAAAVVLLTLGVCTWRQTHVYQDTATLWRDTIQKTPDAWLAHGELGNALLQQGLVGEAAGQYQQALRANPNCDVAHNNLGVALARMGRVEEAVAQFQQTLRINPEYFEAYNNLGLILARADRLQEAIGQYERALQVKPDNSGTQLNIGAALEKLGRTQEASEHSEQALKLQPDLADAQAALARLRPGT